MLVAATFCEPDERVLAGTLHACKLSHSLPLRSKPVCRCWDASSCEGAPLESWNNRICTILLVLFWKSKTTAWNYTRLVHTFFYSRSYKICRKLFNQALTPPPPPHFYTQGGLRLGVSSHLLLVLERKIFNATISRLCMVVISISDPDPGSGAFLTPGSGIRDRFFPDPGSRIQTLSLRAYWQFFTPLFCCCFWIRDLRSGMGKNMDPE